MALKKDKQKVLGEVFDEARVKSFLEFEAPAGVERSYHLLEKAYRGMKADNFSTFVRLFIEAGHDVNSKGPLGKTLLEEIENHRLGSEYAKILKAHA